MKIGILQTGTSPDEIRSELGDYDDLFEQLLAGRGFDFTTYEAFNNEIPEGPLEQQGWIITGSRFGVYEDHAWIPPLEDFVRAVYKVGTPMIGVCFGHQLMAQALGGKVEKFSKGWSVGAVTYEDQAEGANTTTLMAWHQDQVIELPDDAEVVGSSDFCQYAMLAYGDRAYSMQPHPEFQPEFVQGLLASRGKVLPEGIAEQAKASMQQPLSTTRIADRFDAFLRTERA